MPEQRLVTLDAISYLLRDMREGDTLAVLLNGGRDEALRNLFRTQPQIRFYESDVNLGVAGGRNFLFRTQECMSADLIYIIDNDVVVPRGYLDGLEEFYRSDPRTGVGGALILDYRQMVEGLAHEFPLRPDGESGRPLFDLSNEALCSYVYQGNGERLAVYHAGMNPDWYKGYISFENIRNDVEGSEKKPFLSQLSTEPDFVRKLIAFGITELKVSNVGGGGQVISRSVLNEVGLLNDHFNPYGFEDVDFCIRSLKKGFVNRVSLEVLLLHGTDDRHSERCRFKQARNVSRCLTLLAYMHAEDSYLEACASRVQNNFYARCLAGNPHRDSLLLSEIMGIRDAHSQLGV